MVAGLWLMMVGGWGLAVGLRGPERPASVGSWLLVIVTLMIAPLSGLWGAWGVVSAGLNIGWLAQWPIYWMTWLTSSVVQAALGGLMGVRAIFSLGGLSTSARALGRATVGLSVLAMLIGVWMIVAGLLFTGGGQEAAR